MTRLIVLPLPAASRPSKMTTILAPSVRTHSCIFTSSPCRRYSSVSYSLRGSRLIPSGCPACFLAAIAVLSPSIGLNRPRNPRDSMTGVGDDELYRQYETVNLYRRGAGAKVELNRPERMNAWSDQFSTDLLAAIREVTDDPDIRAVAVTGAGRAFSSGFDLKEAAERAGGGPIDVYSLLTQRYHPLITGIRLMPKPVVAAVNGAAAGIGLSLALACDLVVAAESAFFQLAFVNIGLVPDGGSSLFVAGPGRVHPRRGAGHAGGAARRPVRAGMGPDQPGLAGRGVRGQTDALLDRLASGATRSYAGTKRELNRWLYAQMDAQLEFEAGIQRELAASGDFAEGLEGFLAKRPPRFTGA